MPTDVEVSRELARAFWSGAPMECPRHRGAKLSGTFVQTTFADHVVLTCPVGKETLTIPQRPKQMEFYDQQVEGMVENLQRGDAILCYRCQSSVEVNTVENREHGTADYTFTCVRCLSWGRWAGKPELAKIGK